MSKYKSKWTRCREGHKHQSKKEAEACFFLTKMAEQGIIKNLKQQPEFELQPAFERADGKRVRAIKYQADFSFYDNENDRFRVIDTKGYKTQVYRIKEKLFNYIMRDKGIIVEYDI